VTTTTSRGLTIDLVDYFYDWIDGDDPPTKVKQVAENSIDLLFESGARLNVLVREPPEPRSSGNSCANCGGTGEVSTPRTCGQCGGSGSLDTPR